MGYRDQRRLRPTLREPLRDAFRANFDDGLEIGASLAVGRARSSGIDVRVVSVRRER
jgi:hypothetical protein